MRLSRVALSLLTVVTVGVTGTACSNSKTPETSGSSSQQASATTSESTGSASGSPSASTTGSSASVSAGASTATTEPGDGRPITDGKLPDAAPAGFPIPPGAQVTGSTNGGEIDGLLTGVDATKAIAFYRTELPKAGYKITEDDTQGSGGASIVHLAFAGHGFTGSISATGMGGADIVGINLTKA